MELRVEDVIERAKDDNKSNSLKFRIKNKMQPNMNVEFKMLDAYFDMFMAVDEKYGTGFMTPKTLYDQLWFSHAYSNSLEFMINLQISIDMCEKIKMIWKSNTSA